jgi:hypothetical protein
MFLLLVFYYFLELNRHFALKMDSVVYDFNAHDGFISPN